MATRANKTPLNTETLTPAELATWQQPIESNNITRLPAVTAEYDDDPAETGVDRISAMLGGLTEDERAYVKVQRMMGPNKFGHCDDYSIADYEQGGLKMIRDTWGPGEYDIRIYGTKRETGNFGVIRAARVSVLPLRDEPIAAPKQNTELAETLKLIAQGQAQMLTALTTRPPQPDASEEMAKLLKLMVMMKQVTDPAPATPTGNSNVKEMFETMRLMKEMSAEFGPAKEAEEPSLMGMLPNMLELIKGAQQNQQVSQIQAEEFPAVSLPAPQPVSNPVPQAAQQPQENETVDLATMSLMGHLTRMCLLAKTGADPQKGADILYEKLPDEFIDLMAADEWFQMLSGYAPQVKPFEAWFTQARDKALAAIMADIEADNATEAPESKSITGLAP